MLWYQLLWILVIPAPNWISTNCCKNLCDPRLHLTWVCILTINENHRLSQVLCGSDYRAEIYRSKLRQTKTSNQAQITRWFTWFGDVPTSTGRGKFPLWIQEDTRWLQEIIPSSQCWEVEPFRSRTLDLVAVTSNIDRLLRLPLAATNISYMKP